VLSLELGLSRRTFLRGAAVGALLLDAAPSWARSQRPSAAARSVIVLLQDGGMSHLDTWDPKPNAPAEIRGSFAQIQTSNPALVIGEHMPRLAQHAHRYNVVRTVYMENTRRDHAPGLHWVLTGYDNQRVGVALERSNDKPAVGSIVAHELGRKAGNLGLPPYVAVPDRMQQASRTSFAGAAALGVSYDPFDAGAVPSKADGNYRLPVGLVLPKHLGVKQLDDRRALLRSLDGLQRTLQAQRIESFSEYQSQAFELLLRGKGRDAFDLNREPPATRESYGNSEIGQATLLARRLAEVGVPYVLVSYAKHAEWDTHANNFNMLQNRLLPPVDRAVSALLADLDERGLLDEVLVLLLGEMGRTPRINKQAGRDHWVDAYSIMIAGGGLARGRIVGQTSRDGAYAAARPVHLRELLATVYAQLGIDPGLVLYDRTARPHRICPDARPIGELA
jgi:uncharacterized protein (DUF1501 family)